MSWEHRGGGDVPPRDQSGNRDQSPDEPEPFGGDTFILPGSGRGDGQDAWADQPPAGGNLEQGQSVSRDVWLTQDLPPDYFQRPTPKPPRIGRPRGSYRKLAVVLLSVLLLVAIVGGGLLYAMGKGKSGHTTGKPSGSCAVNTPCRVANDYIAAYTGGNYEAMYKLTSQASQKRFSNPAILQGNYKDGHAYIVSRTAALLDTARISSISATADPVQQVNSTSETDVAHITMVSARVGTITEDITLPLVNEGGQWRVDWSPGLIFPQLDDPKYDPNYQRKLRMYGQDAQRGTIFDRDGHPLAQDNTVYQISVAPAKITNEAKLLSVLSASLGMSQSDIKALYAGQPASATVSIRTVPPQVFNSIQSAINQLAGVEVQTTMGRVYPYGTDTAAVTGYVQLVSADDLNNDKTNYYDDGDVIGRSGVEAWGEQYLRPIKGGKLVIVTLNADGSDGPVDYTIGARDPVRGDDIYTTISLPTQQAAMAAAAKVSQGQDKGIFGVNPVTGEVLLMASFPACNPNDFSLAFQTGINACLNMPNKPLFNYAVSGAVPIGSVFKLVTLAAGLENGLSASQVFTCKGTLQVPGETSVRHDWVPNGHGSLTPVQAIPESCDVVFWQVALMLDKKNSTILPNMARSFGYGAPTGVIGVPAGEEAAGIVPDPQWMQQNNKGTWTASDAANLGIGQGFFEGTPAQMAMATAAIANGGKRMRPYLVSAVKNAVGATVQSYGPSQVGTLPVTAEHVGDIQTGMIAAVGDPSGTTYTVFQGFPVRVAGKTGSAESAEDAPHAVFTAYAPASPASGPAVTPQIALAALNTYSGHGADWAAGPLIKPILAQFFHV